MQGKVQFSKIGPARVIPQLFMQGWTLPPHLPPLRHLPNFAIIWAVAFPPWQQGGGEDMGILTDYIVAVMASVVGHYICKWFDRHDKR